MESTIEKTVTKNTGINFMLLRESVERPRISESHIEITTDLLYQFVNMISKDQRSLNRMKNELEPPKLMFHGGDSSLDESKKSIRSALDIVEKRFAKQSDADSKNVVKILKTASEHGKLSTFVRTPTSSSLYFGLNVLDSDPDRSVVLIAMDDRKSNATHALIWLSKNPDLALINKEDVAVHEDDENRNYISDLAERVSSKLELRG